MVVNSAKGFWLKSLIMGKFYKHPGIRLTGTAGEKRLGLDKTIRQ